MYIGHMYVLFGEVCIQVLSPFLMGLSVFLALSCVSSLYVLEINPLSDVSLVNMFFHTVDSLFILLMVSFAVQKLFSLMYIYIYLFKKCCQAFINIFNI